MSASRPIPERAPIPERTPIPQKTPIPDGAPDVRAVQPYQARKTYLCPGCQQEIAPGTGHVVVVPPEEPDLRRHWHRPCWTERDRRRPGRA
jgi:hypothetical protein